MTDTRLSQFHASDGYAFAVHEQSAQGRPRGRLVLLHGIRSHAGWYGRSTQELAEAGYHVHRLDRRGSGLNTAHRGDTPSAARLVADVREFILALRQSQNSLPLFVFGISWGGKLALALAASQPRLVDGVVLVCPGLVPQVTPTLAMRLRIVVARILRPTRRFAIPLNEADLFTASEQWQAFIDADPQGLTEATARFLFESVRLDSALLRCVARVTCPVLLLLAGQDRIVDNAGTRKDLAKLKHARSITIIDDPRAHHTLEFEDQPYLPPVLQWLGCVK